MPDRSSLDGGRARTYEQIMEATSRALRKHGYAGITIQRIADETELSKATFYNYFDGKDDLLLSFASWTLEAFNRDFEVEGTGDPVDDLYAFLGLIVTDTRRSDSPPDEVPELGNWLELRTQAVHDEAYSERFTATTDRYVANLAEIIERGVDEGTFADVDPEDTAWFLLTIIDGMIVETVTRTDDQRARLWESLDAYIQSTVLADGVNAPERPADAPE